MYVYNRNTNAITPIGTANASRFAATKEELFVVTVDQKIMRTDYLGSNFTELYQTAQGNINWIDNFGNILYFIENNERLVLLDTNTGNTQIVLTAADMVSALVFNADKLIWYNSLGEARYYNMTSQQTVVMISEHQINVLISRHTLPATGDASTVTIQAVTADNYNDVTFPLDEYDAVYDDTPFGSFTILETFDGSYAGSNQCDGFAKYAHDRFWHVYDDDCTHPSWVVNGSNTADVRSLDGAVWSGGATTISQFFQTLDRGSFIRYTKSSDDTPADGAHSVVFDKISSDNLGVVVYEANQDWANGVTYQRYSFNLLSSNYSGFLYYVEHALQSYPTSEDGNYHLVECTNCDGYLRQRHTFTRLFNGKYRCTGCGYTSSVSDGTIQSIQPVCVL